MKAWEILEQKGWCQGAYAKNEFGDALWYSDNKAVSYCSMGAIAKAYKDAQGDEMGEAIDRFKAEIGTYEMFQWNDDLSRTKEEVIETMKRADV